MSSSEAPILQQAEIEKREQEISQESPEVQITEISNEQLHEYANVAEQQVEQSSAEIISEGEQKIEVSTKSMGVSPEMEQSVREEKGLDAKLNEVQAEANQIAGEAKGDIEAITKKSGVQQNSPQNYEKRLMGNLVALTGGKFSEEYGHDASIDEKGYIVKADGTKTNHKPSMLDYHAEVKKNGGITPDELRKNTQEEIEWEQSWKRDGGTSETKIENLKQEDRQKSELAEGLDKDPRMEAIKTELVEDWKKATGGEILSAEGQNFMFGNLATEKQYRTSVKKRTEEVFAERFPEDAKAYAEKEKTRVYGDPAGDPALKEVEENIRRITNQDVSRTQEGNWGEAAAKEASGAGYGNTWDKNFSRVSMQQWNNFVSEHPEKAVAYRDKNESINRVFEGQERLQRSRESEERVRLREEQWERERQERRQGDTEFQEKLRTSVTDFNKKYGIEDEGPTASAYTPEQVASMEKERPENETDKRFVLSREGFSRERLDALKEEVDNIKSKYPEVLSFSMYGSMVKGTAHEGSDFDGYLFVDAEKVAEQQQVPLEQVLDASYENDSLFTEEIENKYRTELQNKLKERLQLGHNFVEDIKVRPISEKIIDKEIEKMLKYYSAEEKYEQDSIKWWGDQPGMNAGEDELLAHENKRPQAPKYVETSFANMFNLDVGGGIRKYRKSFIEKLLKLGEKGEKIWADTIKGTEMMENNFSTDETKRYPRTLNEAVKVYG